MQITLNGEPYTLPDAATPATLITRFELDTNKVAIERNLTIVPRSLYETTMLNEGDAVEIVQFIGGG